MWNNLKIALKKHALFIGVYFVLFILALISFKEYGMSWDEQTQRYIGERYCSYVFENDTTFYDFPDRDHGGVFEMALIGVEKLVGSSNEEVIYTTRHLVSHLFFLGCCTFFYFLVCRIFRNQYLALFAFLVLFLNPRIYAHSFFNSKDLPFLGVCVVLLFVLHVALSKGKIWQFIVLGILCGLATSIRFLGVIFPIIIVLVLVLKALFYSEKFKISSIIFMLIFFVLSMFLFFPTLWHKPIDSLIYVYKSLSVFRWEGHVLFNGTQIKSTLLPWYYLPEWIVISIPLSICVLFGVALLLCAYYFKFKLLKNKNELFFLLALVLVIITPLLMVIILHSVVYDDWRHVYFIYPAMILVVVIGVNLIQNKWMKIVGCSIVIIEILYSQFHLYPYQHVYFNALVYQKNENIRYQFDYDYWGVAQKDALNYLLKYSQSDSVKVKYTTVLTNNKLILPKEDKKRLILVDSSLNPKYFITTYRNHPQAYKYKLIYNKIIQGSSIYGIYEIN